MRTGTQDAPLQGHVDTAPDSVVAGFLFLLFPLTVSIISAGEAVLLGRRLLSELDDTTESRLPHVKWEEERCSKLPV